LLLWLITFLSCGKGLVLPAMGVLSPSHVSTFDPSSAGVFCLLHDYHASLLW
jgi:hypothetical protein